jgi:hypothetical protein
MKSSTSPDNPFFKPLLHKSFNSLEQPGVIDQLDQIAKPVFADLALFGNAIYISPIQNKLLDLRRREPEKHFRA